MMTIGIFENDEKTKNIIKKELLNFSFGYNIDFDVLWFDDSFAQEHLEKYIGSACIAFISLKDNSFKNVGDIIAKNNPLCYICYYGDGEAELHSLLKTRPYDYTLSSSLNGKISETVKEIYDRILFSDAFYKSNNKSAFWCCPIRDITYFQSELKYVYVLYGDNKETKIRTTLDNVERDLLKRSICGCFLRIHKSFLVNVNKIRSVDKKAHLIQMDNGQELPISDAQYNAVIEFLGK